MYNNYNGRSDENLQKSTTDVENQELSMNQEKGIDYTLKENQGNPFSNVEKRKGNFFVDNSKYLISIAVVIVALVLIIVWANAQ